MVKNSEDRFRIRFITTWLVTSLCIVATHVQSQPASGNTFERASQTEIWEPQPRVITPGVESSPPSDAIVLFDGIDLSAWKSAQDDDPRWTISDGAMIVSAGTGLIKTRQDFGDVQLHIEWRTPSAVVGQSQDRGNSGIFLMERYEVQVLDSFDNTTYANGQAASIYKQHIPLVNASRGPGEWQTYEIIFLAPEFGVDGRVRRPATITLFHNGVLVQNNVALHGPTEFIGEPMYKQHGKAPITLQDHGAPVDFRNIWLREL